MDRVTSKRIKNNALVEKSSYNEKKVLNKRRSNMNKKKNVFLNDESKNDEVIRKNLKKVKNEKISKNTKDKLETTSLINIRNKENNKKETVYKGIEKEKIYPHINRVSSIKEKSAIVNEVGENRVFDGKNDNVNNTNYTILNYFKNKNVTDKHSNKPASAGDKLMDNDNDALIGNNNNHDTTANSKTLTSHLSTRVTNQNKYLNMKNNIEHNLMNYKKSKLNQIHVDNFSMDSYRSNNSSSNEIHTKTENNNIYQTNQEYAISRSSMSLKEVNLRNSIKGVNKNSINESVQEIRNNLMKDPLELKDLYSSRNCDSSTVLNRSSIYKLKEESKDREGHGLTGNVDIENERTSALSENNFMLRHSLCNGLNGERRKVNLYDISKEEENKYMNRTRLAVSTGALVLNNAGKQDGNGNRNGDKLRDRNGISDSASSIGSHVYSYKERNKDYLEFINLSINRDDRRHKELLVRSLPSKNIMKGTKYDEELFSKNLMNFENYCSYKFKRNINNNLINNICNMYEDRSNLEEFIDKKRRESICKSKEDFLKYKMNSSTYSIKNDHFEGEKLFKRPRMSLYNTLLGKNKFQDVSKVENKERDNISNILLNHQDLLINKREKIVINKNVDTKEIMMKKYIKNFWLLSRKEFFSKYWNSTLHLDSKEVEKLKEIIHFRTNESYTIDDMFNKDNEIIDEEMALKDYVTDEKLKNFRLDLIDGFLYDKQSLYEREMIENEKIFSNISFNHKNSEIKVDKLLNLFPRDFMKKYKIVKKLGEGVYGKVFKAESLGDSYLHFAVKVLRYFWPNFKYKFGSEEFAINEFNIMRILFHPNVVCLLDSFRVHTYRKNKLKSHRNQKIRTENLSAEYDFSFQRHRKVERNQYSPSRETVERNNKYKNLISKSCITIEDLEKDLVMYNIDKEESLNNPKLGNHINANKTVKSLRSYNTDVGGIENTSSNACGDGYFKSTYGSTICTRKDIKKDRSNDLSSLHTKKKMKITNLKHGGEQWRTEYNRIKTNKSIDKLKFRKHSKKLKKIESKNNDYIENWDLFLVIEKCDCSLNDILNKAKKRHTAFIQHIKQCTAQHLPNERIDMSYDHIHNYVKYVYLPLKKIENRSFYPDMPSLSEMQTKVIIYQMLQGINHFHKKFIIHRDIKPANTLIKNIQYLSDGLNDSKEWIVKIADFGLGVYDHFLKAETKDCNIITLQYRPPEILCNSTLYNYSVDIWSVGITMCECLLGFVPVTSKFESSVLFKILVFRGIPNDDFDNLLKKEFIGELPQFKVDRIKMLEIIFTDIYGRRILSDHGIDLIDQFLSYDYKNRITANEALKHKWFEDVHLYLNEQLLRYYKRNGTYYF